MAMKSEADQSNVKVDRMIIDKYIAIIDEEIGYQLWLYDFGLSVSGDKREHELQIYVFFTCADQVID